jgi:RES domain-containing protein
VVSAQRDPLSARGARLYGGRWNPPGLAVLYASIEESVARAEFDRGAAQLGVAPGERYPARLARLAVGCEVVDAASPQALEALGIENLTASPRSLTQPIGGAAAELGIEALLVPSLAAPGTNTVLVLGNLSERIELVEDRLVSLDR